MDDRIGSVQNEQPVDGLKPANKNLKTTVKNVKENTKVLWAGIKIGDLVQDFL